MVRTPWIRKPQILRNLETGSQKGYSKLHDLAEKRNPQLDPLVLFGSRVNFGER